MNRIKRMLLLNVIVCILIFVITLVSKNTFKLEAILSGLPYTNTSRTMVFKIICLILFFHDSCI